jgi:hypothetical protein
LAEIAESSGADVDIAKEATARLAVDRGPFDRVFLFLAIEPGYKVYRLL